MPTDLVLLFVPSLRNSLSLVSLLELQCYYFLLMFMDQRDVHCSVSASVLGDMVSVFTGTASLPGLSFYSIFLPIIGLH
jgi:hypothetical protein